MTPDPQWKQGPVISRREFLDAGLLSFLTVALLDTIVAAAAVPSALEAILASWSRELHGCCADLRRGVVPARIWQSEIQALLERVPLDDLLRLIDLERMMRSVDLPDDRATTRDPAFPPLEGLEGPSPHIRRVFLLRKDRAIVPHGHRNMVSGHLVIHGRLHVRHFERVHDESDAVILRPTIDRESSPGSASTVSDDKDNVHWLVATSDVAATFDVIVPGLDPGQATHFMDFVDPRGGELLGDGTIRAPRLVASQAFARYGKTGG
jgi:hypothetical protein